MRLFCQRIASLAPAHEARGEPGDGLHFEILLRMEDENGRLIAPGAFLPAAERYNLATRLDLWVIEHTFSWLERHPATLARLQLCSINLSGASLGDERVRELVLGRLDDSAVRPDQLCFEITETAAIGHLAGAKHFIESLGAKGCRFALDDFGTGLSSFGYLKTLPVDFVKIDGVFVREILTDDIDLAMVRSINEIGHIMGKQTIAEHAESAAAVQKLREIGVDFVQGYAVGKPAPLSEPI